MDSNFWLLAYAAYLVVVMVLWSGYPVKGVKWQRPRMVGMALGVFVVSFAWLVGVCQDSGRTFELALWLAIALVAVGLVLVFVGVCALLRGGVLAYRVLAIKALADLWYSRDVSISDALRIAKIYRAGDVDRHMVKFMVDQRG